MSFLSSLASAFKGGGRSRVPLARSFVSPWSFALEPAPFEYRGAVRRAFLDNPVAQRAVRIVAEGIGGAPLAASDAEALRLIDMTSAGQSLLETLAAHLLLHGNGYVQVVRDGAGRPAELFALRPERVSVVAGADGWPEAYRYAVGEQVLTLPAEDDDGWPAVIHLKAFHPADDHYGAGCLIAASQAVAIGQRLHSRAAGFGPRHRRHRPCRSGSGQLHDRQCGGHLATSGPRPFGSGAAGRWRGACAGRAAAAARGTGRTASNRR